MAPRAHFTEARMQRLELAGVPLPRKLPEFWAAAVSAPMDAPNTWIHADLHPRNVLVKDGAFAGVIDWGDVATGDPASDIASVWMLLANADERAAALSAYGSLSPATCARARGWAIALGLVLLETGMVDSPRHAAIGQAILDRVVSD